MDEIQDTPAVKKPRRAAAEGETATNDSAGEKRPTRRRGASKPEGSSDSSSSSDAASSDKPAREPREQRPPREPCEKRENDGAAREGASKDNETRSNDSRNDRDFNDERRGGNRNRNRNRDRYRDRDGRNRNRGGNNQGHDRDEIEPEISPDDVLVPVAGILDVLDNYAFVRTSGYLPGSNDVYVSLGQVKKYSLRKGDAVVGAIRQPKEGDSQGRQKFNAIVRIDSINGQTLEEAANRVEFGKLTPLYPQSRLRLETESNRLSTRIIDLVAPIGKGQRGLIVSPPKAGKTLVLQAIANAISTNNPEVHMMVVLVDERQKKLPTCSAPSRAKLLLRPSTVRLKTTQQLPNWQSSARSVWLNSVTTLWFCSTRSPVWVAPTT